MPIEHEYFLLMTRNTVIKAKKKKKNMANQLKNSWGD